MAAPNAQPDPSEPDDVPGPPAERTPEHLGDDRTAPAARPDPADDRPPGDDGPVDVDAQWAGIVAGLGDLSDLDAGAGRPDRADDAGTVGGAGPSAGRDALGSVPVAPWVRSPGPRDWPATPEVEALEEAESHFVPPDPPLVLGRDPLLTMAWSLVAGVPIVLLVLLVVARPFPVVVAQVGGAAFLAGLAVLLWRMPHRRDEDDAGPGAVV
ncbi:hypothetical protein [Cellulosimicrobium cellulans]|uniref:hypothetical protein n=1 Tax=Cellulosimicrobium cellulans TaxID=1710 RepID=UPI0008492FB0|nr:hypothetical protein [Cellulosimicrobium cellulans]